MNKKLVVLLVLGVAAIVWAAAEGKVNRNNSQYPDHNIKGLYIGPDKGDTASPLLDTENKVSRVYGDCIAYDFPSIPAGYSAETPNTTKTGIRLGDPCFVGTDQAIFDGGLDYELKFDCSVVANNIYTVSVLNPTADGGARNPRDAGYCVRIISGQ